MLEKKRGRAIAALIKKPKPGEQRNRKPPRAWKQAADVWAGQRDEEPPQAQQFHSADSDEGPDVEGRGFEGENARMR